MTNLETIAQETENVLAQRSVKKMEDFDSYDEKILGAFMLGEKKEKGNWEKYAAYPCFGGKEEFYQNPSKRWMIVEKQMKQLKPFYEREIPQMIRELGLGEETEEALRNLSSIFNELNSLFVHFYEQAVQNVKDMAEEQGKKGSEIELAQSVELRDEVYRRVLPKKEHYEYIAFVSTMSMGSLLGATSNMIEGMSRTPLIGPLIKKTLEMKFGKVPPIDVIKEYLKDDIAFDKIRAERIYGERK